MEGGYSEVVLRGSEKQVHPLGFVQCLHQKVDLQGPFFLILRREGAIQNERVFRAEFSLAGKRLVDLFLQLNCFFDKLVEGCLVGFKERGEEAVLRLWFEVPEGFPELPGLLPPEKPSVLLLVNLLNDLQVFFRKVAVAVLLRD